MQYNIAFIQSEFSHLGFDTQTKDVIIEKTKNILEFGIPEEIEGWDIFIPLGDDFYLEVYTHLQVLSIFKVEDGRRVWIEKAFYTLD